MAIKSKTIFKSSALIVGLFSVLIVLNSNSSISKIVNKKLPLYSEKSDSLELALKKINAADKEKKLAQFFEKKVKTER